MRCVFDTNVLVSALLFQDSPPRRSLNLAFSKGKVLLSFELLAELYDVLSRKRFRKYIDEEDFRVFLAAFTRDAQWVDSDLHVRVCRDPKDDRILELALSGHATHIVTGDTDLLNPFQKNQILSPRVFLEQSSPSNFPA